MIQSFSRFCEELGAPLYSKAWSWCAVSPERRFALFTVWEDRVVDERYLFTTEPRPEETRRKPGRTELIRVLTDVVGKGYAAYGIECQAADVDAIPRVRASYQSKYLLDLRIVREGDSFFGYVEDRVPVTDAVARGKRNQRVQCSAIDDIERYQLGNDDPEYRTRMAGSYIRDDKVRAAVLRRAEGKCEFCGQAGFEKPDGSRYLETHHVISLSVQGPDRPDNVIALCANDHRRAHFGRDWLDLQADFLTRLSRYRTEH